MWVAYFEEFNTNGTYFENGAWGLDCIDFGIIVDENPEGATICSVGINEDCLGFTQENEFITCEVIPGPCLPNYSITDNGTIDSSVLPAGQNCNFAPFNDEIVELTVTCDGNFNFSLTQDASMNWPGESWLTISAACCSGVIEQTSSFGFLDPTLTIDTYLTEGTYYIIVDIEGNGFPGDYILDVTSDADLTLVSEANAGEDQLTCQDFSNLDGNNPVGNSEVGHMNIGAGRVVKQVLPRIDEATQDGSLVAHDALATIAGKLRDSGGTAHVMGLLSSGGVHAHQNHFLAVTCISIASAGGIINFK